MPLGFCAQCWMLLFSETPMDYLWTACHLCCRCSLQTGSHIQKVFISEALREAHRWKWAFWKLLKSDAAVMFSTLGHGPIRVVLCAMGCKLLPRDIANRKFSIHCSRDWSPRWRCWYRGLSPAHLLTSVCSHPQSKLSAWASWRPVTISGLHYCECM